MKQKYFVIFFSVVNIVYDDNNFPYKQILLSKKVIEEGEQFDSSKGSNQFNENDENKFFARRIKRNDRKGMLSVELYL